MNYTTVDRVLAKLERDYGINSSMASESDLVEWSGEALESIGTVRNYEEAVAVIEVKNGQADLPNGFHAVIQMVRNNRYSRVSEADNLCAKELVSQTIPDNDEKPFRPIVLDCQGQPIEEYELAYYRPYFDLRWEYDQYSNFYRSNSQYTEIRPAASGLYNSLVCTLNSGRNTDNLTSDTYTVIRNQVLRFNFKEGQIMLSYLRQQLDEETGYPLVPDDYSTLTAIVEYINMKVAKKDFSMGREGSQARMLKAESDWQWYCGQAANNALMPKTIDEYEDLFRSRSYIVPRTNAYQNFFGNLTQGENRRYLNPNRGF